MKIILIFAIAVVLVQNVFGGAPDVDRRCPVREAYNKCGTACPATCKNINRKREACIALCVPGCFCISPYVRDDNKRCVLPSECDAKVNEPQDAVNGQCNGRNEVFKNCGSFCPTTCANLGSPPLCKKGCQKGCFCARGFLRNNKNRCVPAANCNDRNVRLVF